MKNPTVFSKHNIILRQSRQDWLLVTCAFDYTCSYKPPHYKATIFSTEQKYLKFQQTQAPKIIRKTMSLAVMLDPEANLGLTLRVIEGSPKKITCAVVS